MLELAVVEVEAVEEQQLWALWLVKIYLSEEW